MLNVVQKLLINADVFTNINKLFLDIGGTCPLHVVQNSFRKGVAALNFDVDQYALTHFFFKLSAGRKAAYKSIGCKSI